MLLRLHHRYGATDNQAARHRQCVTQIVRIFGSPNRWCREIIPTFKLANVTPARPGIASAATLTSMGSFRPRR